jgi:hypothetical protein
MLALVKHWLLPALRADRSASGGEVDEKAMVTVLAFAAALAGGGPRRGTELNTQWFVGDWSPSRDCQARTFTSFLADGSYTAPMKATRRALGIWTFESGVLSIGTVIRMEHFQITRLADDELRSEPVDGSEGATLYRCSR